MKPKLQRKMHGTICAEPKDYETASRKEKGYKDVQNGWACNTTVIVFSLLVSV